MATSLSTAEAAGRPTRTERIRSFQQRHDPHLMLLRRGLVAAVVTPALFAFGVEVLDNGTFGLFATFASFASIGIVWFGGPTRTRATGYVAFGLTGAALVVAGTLCSNTLVAAVIVMFLVGFAIRFGAVFGGYAAAGAGALPLSFVLPVMLPADPGDVVPRVGGWVTGCVVATVALLVFVPDRQREQLRAAAAGLCRDVATLVVGAATGAPAGDDGPDVMLDDVLERIRGLRRQWASMPQHPAGPGLGDQAFLSIMDQLSRASGFVTRDVQQSPDPELAALAFPLRHAVAQTLRASADLLERQPADPDLVALSAARARTRDQVKGWADGHAMSEPADRTPAVTAAGSTAATVVEKVEEDYPLLVISHLAVSIGANALLMAGRPIDVVATDMAPDVPAGGTSWGQTLGRGLKLIGAHFHFGDLAMQQAVRAGLVLAAAVWVANSIPIGHKFWVVLGALSVLRSSAIGTGATGVQAVLGTVIGFALSAAALQLGSSHTGWLWPAVVLTVFLCVYAPTAISFMVGQASFTLFVVFLFTILSPAPDTGVSRVLTVTAGVLVATIGGLVLWPRGAKAVVGRRMAAFYRSSGRYLDVAGHDFLASGDDQARIGLAHVAEQTIEARWTADDAFSGLVGEQRTSPEVLEAWVRVLCVPSSVRQIAAVVGSLVDRGYPACECGQATETIRLELDRIEASLERVASRLEHPHDTTPIGWDGDLTRIHGVLVGCVAEQLARSPADRQSAVGLLWVLEGLHYVDSVLGHIEEPLDQVCASLTAPTFTRAAS